jgi:hypothetical protein
MSEASQFRQLADEALSWAAEATTEKERRSFPNVLTPLSCPDCDAVMKLARVQPAYFYQKVDQRTYACECGETATRFVDRQ